MSNRLILQPTPTAQWYALVNEAENQGGKVDIDLENYLVLTLQKYTDKPELAASILAYDYLESLETIGQLRIDKLRELGDKCLLFSGFFPELADIRQVTVSYFVQMGRHAYNHLSALPDNRLFSSELYASLRDYFVRLMDLLFFMRELNTEVNTLSVKHAEELWRNTGSRYALKILKRHNILFQH
jgi:hypothetical protein